ncbi:MOSC domain-containing protein YiiM [Saccharothrix saharensis]|uniref:MOSC domain-containing protein YiiM n=1 Tax=Saccharothrix saharensis TaxID=571190 RepID=A0A543JMR9_9PSEU|nr:MOSC domain-containing protein [Saccharothrix saharensis]TQM84058.1 MOSC domain-containing protein YiiM [Saccharothrix saharensis]
MPHVLSLNVGSRVEFDQADIGHTGIGKRAVTGPVDVRAPGPRGVGGSGVAGDHISDKRHHGGDDQAVYAYAREDLDEWAVELGRDLRPGLFGENLTTVGVDVCGALIGERWRIGGLLLQATGPRVPCRTFAGVMEERGWVKKFTQRGLPGTYFRVLEPGTITAGDEITIEHRPDHDVTIALAFRALTLEAELLPGLLAAGDDLPDDLRRRVERRVERAAFDPA